MSHDHRVDLLARAAQSLRSEQDAALAAGPGPADAVPSVGDPTLSRILNDVRRARGRRRWLVAIASHLAIGLVGMGVWAVSGRMTASKVRREPPAAAPAKTAFARRPAAAVAVAPKPVQEAAPEAVPETAPEIPADPVPRAAASRPVEPAPSPSAPTTPSPAVRSVPAAVQPPATSRVQPLPPAASHEPIWDALYRDAHHLHFVRRDFAAALAAWDRYLETGSGPLLLEARYNRAIALAHLGRRAEAIAALRSFAAGEAGAYRQAEARALIERFTSGD